MRTVLRRGVVPALVAIGGLLGTGATASAQTPTACAAAFEVPYAEQIGSFSVAAGSYRLTVLTPSTFDCARAATAFTGFLNDWDGRLPAPWRLDPATATFSGGGSAFQIALAGPPAGSGAGQYPGDSVRCPGTYTVVHDDRIGTLSVPAGQYTITLLMRQGLTCKQAVARFGDFLQDFDGRLPEPWGYDAATATFTRRAGGVGFRVDAAASPTPSAGGGSLPGRRCAGVFEVGHDDRIGALRVPKGDYQVTSLGTSCAVAMRRLGQFLRLTDGRLPAPWKLDAATATFSTRGGGFRIKPD